VDGTKRGWEDVDELWEVFEAGFPVIRMTVLMKDSGDLYQIIVYTVKNII
jgi:hypothetical protein